MSEPITLKSGHIFEPLAGPDWSAAKKMFKTFARELKSVEIDLSGIKNAGDLENLDSSVLIKAFLQVAGSDVIEACVFECAAKSLLDGQKITPQTFEAVDKRRDYLPVAWEVMKLTLLPFFEDLLSALPTPEKGSQASQG